MERNGLRNAVENFTKQIIGYYNTIAAQMDSILDGIPIPDELRQWRATQAKNLLDLPR